MPEKETDPEFDRIVSAVETLETVALEHENRGAVHREPCLENRCFIVAMAMSRLNLSVGDIGQSSRVTCKVCKGSGKLLAAQRRR